MRVLILGSIPVGATFGCLDVALPAIGLALQVASRRGVWVEAQADATPVAAE